MNQNKRPHISVIVPFYNCEEFLSEAIESVIEQTFTDWELILADDGSTDGGTSLAKAYAEKYPQQIFYAAHDKHINKAASATRNLGISKASGELIAFLDADDIWLPDYLAGQIETMDADSRISMVCQATYYWYGGDTSDPRNMEIAVGAKAEHLYAPPELIELLYPLGPGAAPCMCGIVIKKSALDEIGGFEESFAGKVQGLEDQAFLTKVYLKYAVYISSTCRNLYRQRPESTMHVMASAGLYEESRRFYLEWLEDYLRRENINDSAVWNLLGKSSMRLQYPLLRKTARRAKNSVKQLFLRVLSK